MKLNENELNTIKEVLGIRNLDEYSRGELTHMYRDAVTILDREESKILDVILDAESYETNVPSTKDEPVASSEITTYQQAKDKLVKDFNSIQWSNKISKKKRDFPNERIKRFVLGKIDDLLSKVDSNSNDDICIVLYNFVYDTKHTFEVTIDNFKEITETLNHYNYKYDYIVNDNSIMLTRGTVSFEEPEEKVVIEGNNKVDSNKSEDSYNIANEDISNFAYDEEGKVYFVGDSSNDSEKTINTRNKRINEINKELTPLSVAEEIESEETTIKNNTDSYIDFHLHFNTSNPNLDELDKMIRSMEAIKKVYGD